MGSLDVTTTISTQRRPAIGSTARRAAIPGACGIASLICRFIANEAFSLHFISRSITMSDSSVIAEESVRKVGSTVIIR